MILLQKVVADPTDDVYKIVGIIAVLVGGILGALRFQSNKTKSDQINKSEHQAMNKLIAEQEDHIEFQDTKIEGFSDKLDKLSQQITQFGVFDLRLKQLELENVERKEENKLIMRKLDGIFNKMSQLEITISNKQNRA
jgi:hypothetical protein